MPRFDGTGPLGQGPRTGRGFGYCSPGPTGKKPRRGLGRGPGRGLGRGFGRVSVIPTFGNFKNAGF